MRQYTGREQEWILDHGFTLTEDGVILIPKSKWGNLAGRDKSIRNPNLRTLIVPTDTGCCLLTEYIHFRIVEG